MFNPALLVSAICFAMSQKNNKQPKLAPKETIDPRIEYQDIYNNINNTQSVSWLIEQSKNNHIIFIDGYVWRTEDLLNSSNELDHVNIIIELVEPRLNGMDGMVIYCDTYSKPK